MRNVIRSRPLGVIVLTLGLSVVAIVNIIVVVVVGLTRFHGAANVGEVIALLVIALLAAAFPLLVAWALWRLERWAFWLTVLGLVLRIAIGSFSLLRGNFNWSSLLLDLVIPALILLYLFTDRDIRRVFRRGDS